MRRMAGQGRRQTLAVVGGLAGLVQTRLATAWWGLTGAVVLLAAELVALVIIAIVWNARKLNRTVRDEQP